MNLKKYFLIFPGVLFLLYLGAITESKGVSEYVGTETCLECHDSFNDKESVPHMKAFAVDKSGDSHGCESCHGPGASHAESGDIDEILSFGNKSIITQNIKNEVCLKCHESGKLMLWHGSVHENRGVSCSDCHRIHSKKEEAHTGVREITTDDRCLECHSRIRSLLLRQSHHPIREGKMKCTDCHNPHGTIAEKLIDAQQVNLKCFECHEEKRGPFLWEHPSVTEDCLSCHTGHGSTHSPLLDTKAPYLCQRCHSDPDHSGTLYARGPGQQDQSIYQAGSNFVFYRACLNCHVSVHGSNHPSGKHLLR